MKAVWNNQIIAESDDTTVVENNHYFPRASLSDKFFKPSKLTSVCGWKGEASYLTLEVDGETNKDAAWFYAKPKAAAENIKNKVAFWKGVEIKE